MPENRTHFLFLEEGKNGIIIDIILITQLYWIESDIIKTPDTTENNV